MSKTYLEFGLRQGYKFRIIISDIKMFVIVDGNKETVLINDTNYYYQDLYKIWNHRTNADVTIEILKKDGDSEFISFKRQDLMSLSSFIGR